MKELNKKDYIINAILPGASLILKNNFLIGTLFLFLGVFGALLAPASIPLVSPEILPNVIYISVSSYLIAALLASLTLFVIYKKAPIDEKNVIILSNDVFSFYMKGEFIKAFNSSKELVEKAKDYTGAWKLLQLTANAAGDYKTEKKSIKKQAKLNKKYS